MTTNQDVLIKEDLQKLENVGISQKDDRIASFTLVNDKILDIDIKVKGIVLTSLGKAIKKYDWVKDIMWTLINPDKDEYTKAAYKSEDSYNGYFIYVPKGLKPKMPLQACFFIKSDKLKQYVHNIIVIDEGASLDIINGCAAANYINEGLHAGITEIFVKKDAKLTYTMIHDWAKEMEVRPRTAVQVLENAKYISNYISIKDTKITQTNPAIYLDGKGAYTKVNSVIFAPKGAYYDVGGSVYLRAPYSKAEILSRSITAGGTIIARGLLSGKAEKVKGHLECDGLVLKKQGLIKAVPELETYIDDVELSHEAAVGKIADDQINYLMTRGLKEDEATGVIVRGFMSIEDELQIPESLKKQVRDTIDLLKDSAL